MSPGAGSGGIAADNELTYEMALQIETGWDQVLSPDLTVEKTVDLADAEPCDTLTYTVTVSNIGTGPAQSVTLVDTYPDGTTETRSLPDLSPGGSVTETFTFVVPVVADNAIIVNTANVSGENLIGEPDDESNNLATASTVVHSPVLELGKSATATVNAGETILYTITYANSRVQIIWCGYQ
jgi:uncharacterized repeat protein (TIGR01451 family)